MTAKVAVTLLSGVLLATSVWAQGTAVLSPAESQTDAQTDSSEVPVGPAATRSDTHARRPDILDSGEVAYGTGKPATSLRVEDKSTFKAGEGTWFLRSDLNLDLPVKGAAGFGVAAGRLGKYLFVDAAFMIYEARYGAIRVTQDGSFDPVSQVAKPRSDADNATLWTIGPGIGTMFRLFGSENWLAVSRFGLNFVQYNDTTNAITFDGGLASFHAEAAYRLSGGLMLAPGVTYNVGYTATQNAPAVASHDKALPVQWWAWQLGLYLWL